jgi:hypothetical protein
VTSEPAEFEADELLRIIGEVRVPEPSVLQNAREVLWSAIAAEMLGTGPAGEQARLTGGSAGQAEEHRSTTRRRQTGESGGERRLSMGAEKDPER